MLRRRSFHFSFGWQDQSACDAAFVSSVSPSVSISSANGFEPVEDADRVTVDWRSESIRIDWSSSSRRQRIRQARVESKSPPVIHSVADRLEGDRKDAQRGEEGWAALTLALLLPRSSAAAESGNDECQRGVKARETVLQCVREAALRHAALRRVHRGGKLPTLATTDEAKKKRKKKKKRKRTG